MSNENKSITTQLNISNNDIVTMLIEERKEQLSGEITKLKNERSNISHPYLRVLVSKIQEFYDSEEFLSFKEQVLQFAKLYNPNLEIEVRGDQSAYEEVYSRAEHYNMLSYMKVCPRQLYIVAVDEDKQDDVLDFVGGGDIYYPPHLEREFKLDMSPKDFEAYNNISQKIASYENEVRNSSGMRDKLVAKMTKQAILANPDLLAIRDSVLRLEE